MLDFIIAYEAIGRIIGLVLLGICLLVLAFMFLYIAITDFARRKTKKRKRG